MDGLDLADRAVVDLAVHRALRRRVSPAESGHQLGALVLRLLRGLHHLAKPRHVRGHRLLTEDVLPGTDRLLEMVRTESRRGREDHHVHAAVQNLVDRVEADESTFVPDHDAGSVLVLESVETVPQTILVDVTHRPEQHAGIRIDRLVRRPGTSAAASDEPHLDAVARGGRAPDGHREAGRTDRRGGLHERAAIDAVVGFGFGLGILHRWAPDGLRESRFGIRGEAGDPGDFQGSQTNRTPTQSLDASHHGLLGICGSSAFQSVVNGIR
jgi:hypothetical protein